MRRISSDYENEQIKNFVRSLSTDVSGAVLELEGEPIVRVLPITKRSVDRARLKTAILKRRDESRTLNESWLDVDREMWERKNWTIL
jgi:hypothetical protein